MKLQFPIGKIAQWADKYDYALQEGDLKRLKDLECGSHRPRSAAS